MRYSKGFKGSIVRRVVDRGEKSVYQVSKETGVSAATINNWIGNHKAGRLDLDSSEDLTPSQRSPGEKLALLLESKTLDDRDRGEWLRRQVCTPSTSPCGSRSWQPWYRTSRTH